jgi:hypothetical protein
MFRSEHVVPRRMTNLQAKRRITAIPEVAMPPKNSKRWVAKVHTDSTHPPKGLFTKDAVTIAPGFEAGFSQGTFVGHEDAELLHQPGGARTERTAQGHAAAGEDFALEENCRAEETQEEKACDQ